MCCPKDTPNTSNASPTCPAGGSAAKCPKAKKCITQITAKVAGTNGKRDPSKTRPDDTLTASSSSDESLSSNAPVILVRGCHEIKLKSVTTPPNEPVAWSIKPNQNSGSAPTLTPTDGGKSAVLKSDQTGSFSVIGELDGCKVVWNVVFVWVKVDTASGKITKRKKFADAGSGGGWCQFNSGKFSAGKYGWEGEVKIKMIGGGSDQKMGIDKVKVKILQNGVTDTLTGHYQGGGTALEVPKGGLPIVDATDASQPFIWSSAAGTVTPNSGVDRKWWSGDSPAGAFPTVHQNSGKKLKSISGVNAFMTAVASVSDDATNSIVVHAQTAWSADYTGTVSGSGKYKPTKAKVTADATFALISDATGGQDALDAGYETFEPRFNGGTDTTWTP